MTISRITQNMITARSYAAMQAGAERLGKVQEQLTTGRVLNRPSDNPADATSAMRLRSSMADQTQYARNAEDGLGWMIRIDSTLQGMLTQLNRAKDLGLQALNATSGSPQSRSALAAEVDQLRENLVGEANTTYLGRPVFGGLVQGTRAYDPSGSFVGIPGAVQRNIGDGVRVQVNVDGPSAFGPEGSGLFANLSSLSAALRAGDAAGIRAAVDGLGTDHGRMTSTLADVGTKQTRLEKAAQAAKDAALNMTSTLSELENVDVARASMDLQLGTVAYQVALAATAKVVQPSLSDFLR